MKYIIKVYCFLFAININACVAQEISPQDLFGHWKVISYTHFGYGSEIPPQPGTNEYEERQKNYHRCMMSTITIDQNGIKISQQNACYFAPCNYNFSKSPHYVYKNIIPNNEYTKDGDGSEMIDSNIVGTKFIKRLDKQYSKSTLTLIDAGCKQEYGDFTLKICIVNKDKIGLFSGADLIILERIGTSEYGSVLTHTERTPAQIRADITTMENTRQKCINEGRGSVDCEQIFYNEMDSILNVVYKRLKKQMDISEFNKLKADQIAWLKKRDTYAGKQDKEAPTGAGIEVGKSFAIRQDAFFVEDRIKELLNKLK